MLNAFISHICTAAKGKKGVSGLSGFKLVDTGKEGGYGEYKADFGQSLFCLALTGAGWGVRLKLALWHGCIPVIISDRVQVSHADTVYFLSFKVTEAPQS